MIDNNVKGLSKLTFLCCIQAIAFILESQFPVNVHNRFQCQPGHVIQCTLPLIGADVFMRGYNIGNG